MSEFNVGDKVYLEGKISRHDKNDNTYCVDYFDYHKDTHSTVWVKDDVLHPADDAYNKGLEDAWELVKKIVINSDDGGYTANELEEMFRTIFPDEVFADFTPQEALAKVKAYEERNEIKVGDVVKLRNWCNESIVTSVNGDTIYRLFRDGSCNSYMGKEDLEKTGKHFDSIDEFMRSAD